MARITKAKLQEYLDMAKSRNRNYCTQIDHLEECKREQFGTIKRLTEEVQEERARKMTLDERLQDERIKVAGLAFENVQLREQVRDLSENFQRDADLAKQMRHEYEELKQELQHKSIQFDASRDTLKRTRSELAEWRESSHKWRALWLDLDGKRLALVNASDEFKQSQGLTVVRRFAQFIAG